MQIKIENARKMRLLSLFFSFQTHFSLLKLIPLFTTVPLKSKTNYLQY